MLDLGLTGKVAIITGASEGLGKATAERFVSEGVRVAICARRKDVLDKAADEIRRKAANGGEVLARAADVTRAEDVEAVVAGTVAQWGGVDILVNNAGTSSAALSSTSLRLAQIATRTPSLTNRSAVAFPSPSLAPVTMATFPVRPRSSIAVSSPVWCVVAGVMVVEGVGAVSGVSRRSRERQSRRRGAMRPPRPHILQCRPRRAYGLPPGSASRS